MNTTNRILVSIIVILILALLGVVVWRQWFVASPYYAVYLRTGDLYFGTLSRFPSLTLKGVYMLQVNRDDVQNPLSIQKFANVFWGPEDMMRINRSEVVWMTKLKNDGQLAQLLRTNPSLTSSNPRDGMNGQNNLTPQGGAINNNLPLQGSSPGGKQER